MAERPGIPDVKHAPRVPGEVHIAPENEQEQNASDCLLLVADGGSEPLVKVVSDAPSHAPPPCHFTCVQRLYSWLFCHTGVVARPSLRVNHGDNISKRRRPRGPHAMRLPAPGAGCNPPNVPCQLANPGICVTDARFCLRAGSLQAGRWHPWHSPACTFEATYRHEPN